MATKNKFKVGMVLTVPSYKNSKFVVIEDRGNLGPNGEQVLRGHWEDRPGTENCFELPVSLLSDKAPKMQKRVKSQKVKDLESKNFLLQSRLDGLLKEREEVARAVRTLRSFIGELFTDDNINNAY